MALPTTMQRELNKAFHNTTSEDNWYPIWNDKLNNWLDNKFAPVACDFEEVIYQLSDSYKVKFDWCISVWRVSA